MTWGRLARKGLAVAACCYCLLALVAQASDLGNTTTPPPKPNTPSSSVCPESNDATRNRHAGGSDSKPKSTTGTIIAIGCVTFASTVANLGMNLQKLALRKNLAMEQKAKEEVAFTGRKAENLRNRVIWVSGLVCIIMGSVGDFGALAFGAQSLIAPLSSLALVANIVIATWMHGEEFSKRDGGCTLIIICGCVVSVVFAQQEDLVYTAPCLFALFGEPAAIAYFIFIITSLSGGMLFVKWIERVLESYGRQSVLYTRWYKFHRFSYACIAGTAGAQSVLLAKCLIEAVEETIAGKGFFLRYWQMYPIIGFLICSVAMQIYWLNMGLARFDALYNVPVFQCFWMLFSTIGGGVFFQEFWSFSAIQAAMFPFGVSLCVFGVFLLSQRSQSANPTDTKTSPDARIGRSESHEAERLENSEGQGLGAPLLPEGTSRLPSSDSDDAFAELDITVEDGHIGIGLYPEIVKITHPKYSRVQCMVKVWKVRDFPPDESGGNGQAERQGVTAGMILVGIDGYSLLEQSNSWGTALEKLRLAKRPVSLTFRDICTSGRDSPPKRFPRNISQSMDSAGGGRSERASSFGASELMLSAGKSTLKRGRVRSASYRPISDDDVLVAHRALNQRPMVGSTLNLIHAGQFSSVYHYDQLVSDTDRDGHASMSPPSSHPLAEFAHHIGAGFPPILDRVLDTIAPVHSVEGVGAQDNNADRQRHAGSYTEV